MSYDHDTRESWEQSDPAEQEFEFWMTIDESRSTAFKKAAETADVEIKLTRNGHGVIRAWTKPDQDMEVFWKELETIEGKCL